MDQPTRRRLLFLRVSLLLATGKRSKAYSLVSRGMNNKLCTTRQVSELYLHLSLLLGVPATLEAISDLHRSQRSWKMNRSSRSRSDGMKTFQHVYGSQAHAVLRSLKSISPSLREWVIRDVYGNIYSRRGLALLDREIVTFAVLAYQRFDPQCHSHMRGARRLGVSETEIRRYLREVESITGRSTARYVSWLNARK